MPRDTGQAAIAETAGPPAGDTALTSGLVHPRSRNGAAGRHESRGSWDSDRAESSLLFDNDGNDHFMPIMSDTGSLLDPKAVATLNQRGSGKRTGFGLHHSKISYSKWIIGIIVTAGMLGFLWQAQQQPASRDSRYETILHLSVSHASSIGLGWPFSLVVFLSLCRSATRSHATARAAEKPSAAPHPPRPSYKAKRAQLLDQEEGGGRGVIGVRVSAKPGAPFMATDSSKPQCPARNGTRPEATAADKKVARNAYGYRRRQRRYSFEQYPKVVHGDDFRFIMCTIPKNGCSQWKRLILKAMGKPMWFYLDQKTSHLTVHSTRYRYLPMIPKAKMMDALTDPDTARVIISRNPFTRVLSSYLNKIVKANDRRRYREKLGLDQWSDWVTFEEYVNALEKWAAEKPYGLRLDSGVDHHFALQSSFCGMANDRQSNLHYDYILKTEEINDWYTCIVKELNISSLVYSGWPGDKCFFSAPDNPCDGQTMTGGFSSNQWDARDHGTKSSTKLRGYYSPELEATVARLYADDFQIFGYHNRLNQSTVSDLGYEWQEAPAKEGGAGGAE